MRDAKAAYSSAVDDQAVAVGELAAASSLRDWSRDPQAPYKLRAGPVVPIAFDATDPVLILDVIAALRQVIEPPQPKPFPVAVSVPAPVPETPADEPVPRPDHQGWTESTVRRHRAKRTPRRLPRPEDVLARRGAIVVGLDVAAGWRCALAAKWLTGPPQSRDSCVVARFPCWLTV
jgi:hypothetical protein